MSDKVTLNDLERQMRDRWRDDSAAFLELAGMAKAVLVSERKGGEDSLVSVAAWIPAGKAEEIAAAISKCLEEPGDRVREVREVEED